MEAATVVSPYTRDRDTTRGITGAQNCIVGAAGDRDNEANPKRQAVQNTVGVGTLKTPTRARKHN